MSLGLDKIFEGFAKDQMANDFKGKFNFNAQDALKNVGTSNNSNKDSGNLLNTTGNLINSFTSLATDLFSGIDNQQANEEPTIDSSIHSGYGGQGGYPQVGPSKQFETPSVNMGALSQLFNMVLNNQNNKQQQNQEIPSMANTPLSISEENKQSLENTQPNQQENPKTSGLLGDQYLDTTYLNSKNNKGLNINTQYNLNPFDKKKKGLFSL